MNDVFEIGFLPNEIIELKSVKHSFFDDFTCVLETFKIKYLPCKTRYFTNKYCFHN